MLGSFLLLYFILTLYGTSLMYKEIKDNGCDPSIIVEDALACSSSGPDVFGAMLGVAFAAQGLSQFGNFSEAFTNARIAVFEALKAINRKEGSSEEIIYKNAEDDIGSTTHSKKTKKNSEIVEEATVRGILPKYEIDSSSKSGAKPKDVSGAISFKNVHFAYPTRPTELVLNGLSVDIQPGQTVAFVGPR